MSILKSKKTILGLFVSVLFIYLAFRKFEYILFIETLRKTNIVLLILAVSVYISAFIVRSVRWQRILIHLKRIRSSHLFSALMAGYAANNLLPARTGEFVRAYVLSKTEDLNIGTSFLSIVLERIFDGLVIVGFGAFFLFSYSSQPFLKKIIIYSGLFFYGIFLVFLLFVNHKSIWRIFLEKILYLFPKKLKTKIIPLMDKLIQGIGMLNNCQSILLVFFLSILVWLFELGTFYLIGMSLNMRVHIIAYILTLVIVNLGIMLPSSPAYIGVIQYCCIVSFSVFNVKESEALAYSVVLNGLWFMVLSVMGIFYIWKLRIRWAEVKKLV